MSTLFTGNIRLEKRSDGDTITMTGIFGADMKFIFASFLSKQKMNALFLEIYPNSIKFHTYYALEVHELIMAIINWKPIEGGSEFRTGLNLKLLQDLADKLKKVESLRYKQYTGYDPGLMDNMKKRAKGQLNMGRIKDEMNFGILPHQVVAFEDYALIKLINELRGDLLAAEPGTGKTFMALAMSLALDVDRVVIVAPKATIEEVWISSLTGEMFKKPNSYFTSIDKAPYRGEKFIVVHYEYIKKLDSFLTNDGGKTMFIVDESHNLNEKNPQRTKDFIKLIDEVEPSDVILLTGTSIKGKTLEVSNMLKFCDSKFNDKMETIFEELYKSPTYLLAKILPLRYEYINTYISKDGVKLPKTYTIEDKMVLSNGKYFELEEIRLRMKSYALERNKFYDDNKIKHEKLYNRLLDKGLKLSIKNGNVTKVEIDGYRDDIEDIKHRYANGGLMDVPKTLARTNAFEVDVIISELSGQDIKDFREMKSVIKYVSLKIQGEILARVVMRTRIDLAISMAEQLDYGKYLTMTKKKTLLFSSYGEACKASYEKIKKHTKCLQVYWEHTKNLAETVREFHTNDKAQALVATYKSLSTGVEVKAANLTIFFDLPFKSYIYGQATARTHRIGQDEPCTFVQLLLDTGDSPNINSRNIDIIKESKDVVEMITRKKVKLEFKEIGEDGKPDDGVKVKGESDKVQYINDSEDVLFGLMSISEDMNLTGKEMDAFVTSNMGDDYGNYKELTGPDSDTDNQCAIRLF